MDIAQQIDLAKRFVAERPSDELARRVERRVARIHRRIPISASPEPVDAPCVWTYAIEGNDRSAFYNAMIAHQAGQAGRYGMRHTVSFSPTPDVDMFERCLAMTAFLHATDAPVAFLDNDAFPNADLRPVFDQIEHVGLTVRHDPGLMPVNEGVIFARPTDEARKFFLSYLATYERLKEVMKPDDWRWWGGQLALNAVAAEMMWSVEHGITGIEGLPFTYLDCNTHNYSPDGPQTRETLDGKLVLHLKGPRKALFDQLVKYQEGR